MTPWIVVTVVSKSATSCEIETFMTAASSTIRNCEAASTIRTRRLDTGSALRVGFAGQGLGSGGRSLARRRVIGDLTQRAGRRARRDRVRRDVTGDDAVGADHGPLSDRHAA